MDIRAISRGHNSGRAARKPLQDTTATTNNYSPARDHLKPRYSSYVRDGKPQNRYGKTREEPGNSAPHSGVVYSVAERRGPQYSTATPTVSNPKSTKLRKDKARVGPWVLGRTLGKGSSGRVRLARHTGTGQLAAIKIVGKNQQENSPYGGQIGGSLPSGLEREVVIMRLINHPNVMGLLDVWENRGEL